MFVANPLGFILSPSKQWRAIADLPLTDYPKLLLYPLLMSLLAAVPWYYGVTDAGWSVGGGAPIRLTDDSAMAIVGLFYLAMLGAVAVVGYLTHWMSQTYEAQTSLLKGICIASFVSTPLYLAGLVGFYPLLWLDLCVGVLALSWTLYLLYTGIPLAMKLSKEQGFLYASAIVGVGMVMLICIMVGSVILWDFGFAPVFID